MTVFWRVWKRGSGADHHGPVHVSMNDFLIHRAREVPRVGVSGLRFRHAWPRTPGALGLWVASTPDGRRQISVSVWRDAQDLKRFVRTPGHLRVMREFRGAGDLYTNAWTAPRLDRRLIWQQAQARLTGQLPEVPHH